MMAEAGGNKENGAGDNADNGKNPGLHSFTKSNQK
jgi:hypothetical protein